MEDNGNCNVYHYIMEGNHLGMTYYFRKKEC